MKYNKQGDATKYRGNNDALNKYGPNNTNGGKVLAKKKALDNGTNPY